MGNGETCAVSDIAVITIKIHSFTWKRCFLILGECPIPCLLGVDFMTCVELRIDFASRRYSFLFCPDQEFDFGSVELSKCQGQKFSCPEELVSGLLCGSMGDEPADAMDIVELIREFPALFLGSWAP